MWRSFEGVKDGMNWPLVLLVAVGGSVLYTTLVLGYALLPFSQIDIGGPIWQTVGFSGLTSLATIGVPVALWGRYRLRTPIAFMGFMLLFWHVIVEVPLLGNGLDNAPGFLFVFVLAPVYVVFYAFLAGVEYRRRAREKPEFY